jgi:hypothetical protein
MDTKKVWETIKKEDIPKEEDLSSMNESLKSKETEFSEPDSLHADTVVFRVSISTKVLLL